MYFSRVTGSSDFRASSSFHFFFFIYIDHPHDLANNVEIHAMRNLLVIPSHQQLSTTLPKVYHERVARLICTMLENRVNRVTGRVCRFSSPIIDLLNVSIPEEIIKKQHCERDVGISVT